jgi:hypothetical protein
LQKQNKKRTKKKIPQKEERQKQLPPRELTDGHPVAPDKPPLLLYPTNRALQTYMLELHAGRDHAMCC